MDYITPDFVLSILKILIPLALLIIGYFTYKYFQKREVEKKIIELLLEMIDLIQNTEINVVRQKDTGSSSTRKISLFDIAREAEEFVAHFKSESPIYIRGDIRLILPFIKYSNNVLLPRKIATAIKLFYLDDKILLAPIKELKGLRVILDDMEDYSQKNTSDKISIESLFYSRPKNSFAFKDVRSFVVSTVNLRSEIRKYLSKKSININEINLH